jgi:deazaflavin-dependent oxidoreductase (nitroreductase family)
MAALTRSPAVEFFWKFHRALYKWTNGFFGGRTIGMPVLLLTTTGRRSRQPRTTPLTYLDHDDAFVVFASCLGEPKHPAWWLNLEADPSATVQIGGQRIAVRAREAEGAERETLWDRVVKVAPDYDEYKRRTSRRIPVVVLERAR